MNHQDTNEIPVSDRHSNPSCQIWGLFPHIWHNFCHVRLLLQMFSYDICVPFKEFSGTRLWLHTRHRGHRFWGSDRKQYSRVRLIPASMLLKKCQGPWTQALAILDIWSTPPDSFLKLDLALPEARVSARFYRPVFTLRLEGNFQTIYSELVCSCCPLQNLCKTHIPFKPGPEATESSLEISDFGSNLKTRVQFSPLS